MITITSPLSTSMDSILLVFEVNIGGISLVFEMMSFIYLYFIDDTLVLPRDIDLSKLKLNILVLVRS
jgi:hypothetical protein